MSTIEQRHKGKIVEIAVRNSGYPIAKVAQRMGITRNTLYNKFQVSDLTEDFIVKIGRIIHYDFSVDLPELRKYNVNYLLGEPKGMESYLLRMEGKYNNLADKYNALLEFLIKISNQNDLSKIKQDIVKFSETESL